MTSRLDRLFVLLESGSSAPTRRAAAKQLGEVQRLHPHELHSLLRRIKSLLQSPCWETRVAAGQAVAAVVASLPPWDPLPTEDQAAPAPSPHVLDKFDIRSLLKSGAQLTGSEGTEYDVEAGKQPPFVISTGLSTSEAFGVDLTDILTAEDLVLTSEQSRQTTTTRSVSEMVEVEISSAGGQSSRERNLARRRAKLRPFELSKPDTPEGEEPRRKKSKVPDTPGPGPGSGEDDSTESVPDGTGSWVNAAEWPLQGFCDDLLSDLFSPRWETRHGSATALREVLVGHGKGAGKSIPATKAQMDADHEAWLQDATLRILSVLCLDRFGDFVSDTVVAPVRETCAQVLGALFKLLASNSVHGVLRVIEQMCQQTPWETRHGAMLALKYCLSVRKELVEEVLSKALPLAAARLYDSVDDVSGVAAAALVPVAEDIARVMTNQLPDLIRKLWSILQEQDDLTAASHAFMGLLAALLNCPAALVHLQPHCLDEVLPRLWPFFGHNSTSVRRSTLHTLHTLTTGRVVCSTETLLVTLRHLYQRSLLESAPDVLKLLEQAWGNLVCGSDSDRLMEAACPYFGTWLCLAMQNTKIPFDHSVLIRDNHMEGQILYLGGGENSTHCLLVRVTAARMLGLVSKRLLDGDLDRPDSPLPYYANVILTHLASKSALQRLICGLVLTELHRLRDAPLPCPDLNARVLACAMESIPFEELSGPLARLLADARDFIMLLPSPRPPPPATIEDTVVLASQAVSPSLEERRVALQTAADLVQQEHAAYTVSVQAALAGSLVHLKNLGDRMSPIVRPLMESVRRESEELIQRQSAENLALLVSLCVRRTPCPNGKIISNLRAFICEDFPPCKSGEILTSIKQLRDAERIHLKRQNSQSSRGPGRPPCVVQAPSSSLPDRTTEQREKAASVQRRGATLALQAMVRLAGESLPNLLSQLWTTILPTTDNISAQDLTTNLQVLEAVAPALPASLLPQVLDRLDPLNTALGSDQPALRHTASRAFSALSLLAPERVMKSIVTKVLPLLNSNELNKRAGAAEVLACVIATLQLSILPYTVLLLVPLLGRMTDSDPGVRSICTQSFASLVQIMPLDGPHLDSGLLAAEQAQERVFLQQLLNPSTIPDFVNPVPVNAQLRAYQQAGINWLAFLNKYKLHGILCDDMGLGKTLQTICMLAADHSRKMSHPSLVICPPTLTGHWVAEVDKFVSSEHLEPLLYAGIPSDRERLRGRIGERSLVIASYDIVRKDIEYFRSVTWNYCVLDEGHIIKNGKTKASKAIKSITANHRLILSGTPIQNNVLELWSLFDFLMPGFLGSERQFNTKFGRPILASRDAKVSSKEQEAGVMAMEALHRQVLPFLLRRVKEDVLKDLPPRITQDYVCELSPLQGLLYEDFSKTQAHQHLEDSLSHSNSHIFQALRYLQNVCNHPQLVLTAQHPQYDRIQQMLQQQNSTIHDIGHACKLPALKQLLLDCGIGLGNDAPITQHRALIFCQLKAMLDVVERLLTQHLPSVSYLRLDGTVPPLQRHTVVHKFNTDPTIDVLLLTTHVGGLGLNLTGADTVIFVEHDWNPMKDLQAMDRAHRIGQKKVVNVYRLITKGTLEEKIMGLQKFKLLTANTVISQQNSALETMATHGLLDLFTLQTDSKKQKENSSGRSLMESLPDLWEQNQYDEEYDLSAFVSQLSR